MNRPATLLLALGCVSPVAFAQSTITPIGPVTTVRAISADGSTIVGRIGAEAFRWTAATGLVPLGTLPGGASSEANAVSADGSIVVGASTSPQGTEAFRWSLATGMQGLGTFGPLEDLSIATGISGDGSIIVGRASRVGATSAFRWTAQAGMEPISCGTLNSAATAISADGSTIIGNGWAAAPSVTNAFAWRNGNCIIPPTTQTTSAIAASADGTIVLGSIGNLPARWINGAASTMAMPGAVPLGASADAFTFVGTFNGLSFIAHPGSARTLTLVLCNFYGLDLSAWSNFTVQAISADARTIAGTGLLQGQQQGWIVRLGDPVCYANCDGSTVQPILNVADFACFMQRYAAGHIYAACDGPLFGPIVEPPPDFGCFLAHFAAGCP